MPPVTPRVRVHAEFDGNRMRNCGTVRALHNETDVDRPAIDLRRDSAIYENEETCVLFHVDIGQSRFHSNVFIHRAPVTIMGK